MSVRAQPPAPDHLDALSLYDLKSPIIAALEHRAYQNCKGKVLTDIVLSHSGKKEPRGRKGEPLTRSLNQGAGVLKGVGKVRHAQAKNIRIRLAASHIPATPSESGLADALQLAAHLYAGIVPRANGAPALAHVLGAFSLTLENRCVRACAQRAAGRCDAAGIIVFYYKSVIEALEHIGAEWPRVQAVSQAMADLRWLTFALTSGIQAELRSGPCPEGLRL